MKFEKIFIVDDDPLIRSLLQEWLNDYLEKESTPILRFNGGEEFLSEFRKDPCGLVILDLKLPDFNGLDLMRTARQISLTNRSNTEFVIITGFGTVESAVEAIKLGANNYLLKPFTLAQFEVALSQLIEQRQLRNENAYFKEQMAAEMELDEMVLCSPEMQHIVQLAERVAATPATVLIHGESGTGKEVISRLIHRKSPRKDKPFIKINCAAVPENLLESEFFGHEKGSFTGATFRREGRFELANGGTLLLDEVTEISPSLQGKLLRVLQEQEFERVGGNRTIKVDVRVIATTNRKIEESIEQGRFRQDLYYRLNVVPITIPPLRHRKGAIEPFLKHFIQKFSRKHDRPPPKFGPLLVQQLCNHPWHGNVRELQNCVERALILSGHNHELAIEDFMITAPTSKDEWLHLQSEFPTIEKMEQKLIDMALKMTHDNRSKAAEMLGINVRTLRNKLNQCSGEKPEDENATAPGEDGSSLSAPLPAEAA